MYFCSVRRSEYASKEKRIFASFLNLVNLDTSLMKTIGVRENECFACSVFVFRYDTASGVIQ